MPPQGENRINGMVGSKPDWVISRQRAWGVPIAVFIKEKPDGSVDILQDPEVDLRIVEAFEKEGADAWYKAGARERFLGPKRATEGWKKVDDILDVWFDSGSTHAFVLEDPVHFPSLAGIKRKRDGGRDTVLYLEGSDQHRGWFQSSLLESCGTRGRAPFDVVVTHGFTQAEDGRKMSKSLGNTIAPQDVIKQSGADILRMWVASCDYWDDQRIGPEILKSTADTYRKLRNTIRWMLGTLAHFHEDERVKLEAMPELERLMLHRLTELDALVRKAYAEFDYKRIFAALSAFMTSDLSAFYFDIRKDTLYCDPISSVKRKASLTVIDHLFRCTVTWLAPMLCFTAEESLAVALRRRCGFGASRDISRGAGGLARRRAGRQVAQGAYRARRRHRRAGDRARAEAHRLLARSASDRARLQPGALRGGGRHRSRRSLHHLGGDARRRTRAPPMRSACRMSRASRSIPNLAEGTKCARSWKILTNIGADPALSGRFAARCQGAARMGSHAQGGGMNARLSSLGPLTLFRHRRRGDRLPARSGQQALSAVRVRSRRPSAAARPVFRFRAHPQYRHQLRLVPDRRARFGQWVLLGFKALAVAAALAVAGARRKTG